MIQRRKFMRTNSAVFKVAQGGGWTNRRMTRHHGTIAAAEGKASILVNGSPTKEFSCYRDLKQGDSLAPYLFILVMESLHLSFSRVVEEDLFKGVMVGDNMSRLKVWDDVILKIKSRLSKWKVKTLSIGGRLTLLKSVLSASPIYDMSIFTVPRGVLKALESIHNRFFNGADQSDHKITWVAWDKVLASKKKGGLGVSSFFALNRALLLKWVWRFVSQDGSLWCEVYKFCDGTLEKIQENLFYMVKRNKLGTSNKRLKEETRLTWMSRNQMR
nr:RNA-directed DNA polymerase, eukaryota [Tanacetum cinerariifolium]